MSNSAASDMSRINLTDEKDVSLKKIQKAKTDTFVIPEKKEELINRPEAENLLTIYASLTNKSLEESLRIFCGSDFKKLKAELSDLLISELDPISQEIKKLLKDKTYLKKVLKEGSEKARAIADPILKETFEIIGMVK